MLAPLETGAAALRAELDRNKVVNVGTSIDAAIAAKVRYTRPQPESRPWARPGERARQSERAHGRFAHPGERELQSARQKVRFAREPAEMEPANP
jgi:hypothetical protein